MCPNIGGVKKNGENRMKNQKKYYEKLFCELVNAKEEGLIPRCEQEVKRFDSYWYENYKDFSFYSHIDYIYDMFYCFNFYSRNIINASAKYFDTISFEPQKILDFGAGIGLTTHLIKKKWPNAKVYYYNIGDPQIQLAKKLSEKENLDIVFLNSEEDIQKETFDLIFTTEVLEHFEEPLVPFLLLKDSSTNYWVDVNTFSIKSAGHFDEYILNGEKVSNQKTRAKFCKEIKKYYELAYRGFNMRPRIWRKKSENTI